MQNKLLYAKKVMHILVSLAEKNSVSKCKILKSFFCFTSTNNIYLQSTTRVDPKEDPPEELEIQQL